MEIDNKYITLAYRLYTIEDGEEDEEPVEVANRRHPFQFISGLGLVLAKFEENVRDLARGDEFDFVIPCADAYGEFNDELMFDVPETVFMVDGKIMILTLVLSPLYQVERLFQLISSTPSGTISLSAEPL